MFESLFITLVPVGFLIVLFGGGALFRRRNIDMDGDPPIRKALFLSSKHLIVLVWAATAIHSWGIGLSAAKMRIKRGREEFRRRYADVTWAPDRAAEPGAASERS